MIRQPKDIKLSKSADTALSSLPESIKKKFDRAVAIMMTDINFLNVQGKIYKLNAPIGEYENIFIIRIDIRYRALINIKNDVVYVMDIVDHSSLKKTFNNKKS